MPISFNCEHCGKNVKAPDGTGGKWGSCPHCKGRCYVPNIVEDEEELRLTPLDEEDQQKSEQLLEEEKRIRAEILRQSQEPD